MLLTLILNLALTSARAERLLRVAPEAVRSARAVGKGIVAEIGGHRVFIKTAGWGERPCGDVLNEARMSQLISPTGIGPGYLGRLDNPVGLMPNMRWYKQFGLIYEYVEGEVLRGVLAMEEDEEEFIGWLPELEVADGVRILPHTIEQVEHAFDTLAELRVEGADIQFMITPEGDARLIDYGIYRRVRSVSAARNSMREEREALVEGLRRRMQP